MSVIRRLKFAKSLSAAVMAMGLSLAAGAATVLMTAVPAAAQVTLSAEQTAAIQSSLRDALRAAQTDEAKEAAISQAIQTAVALYGSGTASSITSVVMQTAEEAGIAPALIGTGLAQASAALAATNMTAASSIASTVANEGNALERSSYQTASTGLGYANLASIAAAGPTVTGGTGSTVVGGAITGLGGSLTGGSTSGGGCLNPSCTKL